MKFSRLYTEWLVGDGNPRNAPSYSMSYADFIADRVIALEDQVLALEAQVDSLLGKETS